MASFTSVDLDAASMVSYDAKARMLQYSIGDSDHFTRLPNTSFTLHAKTRTITFRSSGATKLVLYMRTRQQVYEALSEALIDTFDLRPVM